MEPVSRTVNGLVEPIPIDFGPPTDELFLLLFGTGLRGRTSLASVRVTIGEGDAPVKYGGPQGEFAGLDHVNVRLPRSLSGAAGELLMSLAIDGKAVNTEKP